MQKVGQVHNLDFAKTNTNLWTATSNKAKKRTSIIILTKKRNILFTWIAVINALFSLAQTTLTSPMADSAYNPNKIIPVNQLQFDLAILKDALVKCHPGLFWHQSENDFEQNYAQLRNDIGKPMTELEFFNLLTPFIGSIKCDHTNLEMSEAFSDVKRNTSKVFPFILKIIDKHVYVNFNCSNDTTVQRGSEILSINGIDADSIRKFAKPRSWADGFVESYAYMGIESAFTPLFLNFFHQAEVYKLKIKKPDGSMSDVKCDAVVYKRFKERYEKQTNTRLSAEFEHQSFSVMDSLSTCVIKINAFEGDNYYTFLNKAFTTIKEKGVENLIIDLRGNGGGDGEYTGPLYRRISLKEYRQVSQVEMKLSDPEDTILKYGKLPEQKKEFIKFCKRNVYKSKEGKYLLKYGAVDDYQEKPFAPRKDRFTGNVYVLTDVSTSSGGSEVSGLIHYNKRGKFIGRETGGGYLGNTSGWDFALTLPNSKIIIHIPLFRSFHAVSGYEHRGIPPDYPIKEDFNDLILNRDSELLYTLDLIKKAKNENKK